LNYEQSSFCAQNEKGNYHAYIWQIDEGRLSLIVVEKIRLCKDGYKRREWFFCTCKGQTEEVYSRAEKMINPRNMVAAWKLEPIIDWVISDYLKKRYLEYVEKIGF